MTVTELRRKYKGYHIMLFGRPLEQQTTPYTLIPKHKSEKELEVVDLKIKEEPCDSPFWKLGKNGLTYMGKEHTKGSVYAYVVKSVQ